MKCEEYSEWCLIDQQKLAPIFLKENFIILWENFTMEQKSFYVKQ